MKALTWPARIFLAFILVCALVGSGPLQAGPLHQEGQPVYGVRGLLRASDDVRFDTVLVTAGGETYPIVGATPEIDLRIQRIRANSPETPVKVWGTLTSDLDIPAQRQIVATDVLVEGSPDPVTLPGTPESDPPADDRPIAAVQVDLAPVRDRPDTSAQALGQVRREEIYEIVGRDTTNRWWLICCLEGATGWILQTAVSVEGDTANVPLFSNITPRPTPVPVPTGETTSSWSAAYFNNRNAAEAPVATARVEAIDLDWSDGSPTPVVSADNFSARFENTIGLPYGSYRLYAQADDGVRVWVNGDLVIDEWRLASGQVYTASRRLGGPTHFRVEFFEAGGQAAVNFWYELAEDFPDWRASYYDNPDLAGSPAWVQGEPRTPIALNQNWGLQSPVPGVIPADNWSGRWTGNFAFQRGNYVIWARADDGVRVWLDEYPMIDGWRDGAQYLQNTFLGVGEGRHTVTVEYYQRAGLAQLEVSWYRATGPQLLP